jgi:ribosomal protein S14
MMKTCDACGKPQVAVSMGGAMLCRICAEDVRQEIDRLHTEGKPVSAMGIARRMFRETHSAGSYLLRDIPEDLWTQAKHTAIDKGLSLRDLILEAVRAYIS